MRSEWPPAGHYQKINMTSSGTTRDYILQLPDNYDDTKPYRLIIGYHWYTGNAMEVVDCHTESIDCYTTQSPFFGLWMLAEGDTIFVAPDGLNAGWANSNGEDVTLTDDILQAVEGDLCIDKTRVFANGFSYGASMTSVIGCARSSAFRGIAVYSGSPILSNYSSTCTTSTPAIATYLSHGTQDGTNVFSGGQQIRDHFAQSNGCAAPNPPLNDNPAPATHTCTSYLSCSAGHPLRWCVFGSQAGITQDHTPSPRDGKSNLTWNPEEVWNFVTQF